MERRDRTSGPDLRRVRRPEVRKTSAPSGVAVTRRGDCATVSYQLRLSRQYITHYAANIK